MAVDCSSTGWRVARVILALVLAIAGWAVSASFMLLGFTLGWSGHPAAPDMPWAAYIAVFGVGLPLLSLLLGWRLSGRITGRA